MSENRENAPKQDGKISHVILPVVKDKRKATSTLSNLKIISIVVIISIDLGIIK